MLKLVEPRNAGDILEPYVVTDSHVIRMVQLNPNIDIRPKFLFKTGRFPRRVKWVSSAFWYDNRSSISYSPGGVSCFRSKDVMAMDEVLVTSE